MRPRERRRPGRRLAGLRDRDLGRRVDHGLRPRPATELMGVVSFPDLAFLLVAQRLPTPGESSVLNAVLVSLADHGLTPTALAARLTYTGAPEAMQAAVAAGLLGAGSVFLGPTEDTALFLSAAVVEGAAGRRTAPKQRGGGGGRAGRSGTGWPQGSGCPGWVTRCTRSPTRGCRGSTSSPRRPGCSARTCGCCGPSLRSIRSSPAAAADQRRRGRRRGAGRPRAAAGGGARVSRCWPAPPDWSGTSPRSAASRSGGKLYEDVEHRMTYRPPAAIGRPRAR